MPIEAWAELDGTITNEQGMVQRLHRAIPAPGTARPGWQAITALAKACAAALNYDTTQSVFTEMVTKVDAFKTATWQNPVLPIQLRWANSRG